MVHIKIITHNTQYIYQDLLSIVTYLPENMASDPKRQQIIILAVSNISNVTTLYQLNSVQAFGSAMEVREGYLKITTGQIIMSLSRQAMYAKR